MEAAGRAAGCRAQSDRLVAAGVDGIEIYESEIFAAASHYRWLVPLWRNARLASLSHYLTEHFPPVAPSGTVES